MLITVKILIKTIKKYKEQITGSDYACARKKSQINNNLDKNKKEWRKNKSHFSLLFISIASFNFLSKIFAYFFYKNLLILLPQKLDKNISGMEEKYKMPISNPNPSNSVLTKKIPKKPILNREILEDIFIEIMKVNTSMRSWSDSPSEKNIARFMASGRQPFNIALNYFTRINSVNIWRNTTHLYMNNETICKFTFEYFAFLKPVLYAIGSSIKKFVFCDAVGVDIDMIFDALIHEGIEYVCVDEKIKKYKEQITGSDYACARKKSQINNNLDKNKKEWRKNKSHFSLLFISIASFNFLSKIFAYFFYKNLLILLPQKLDKNISGMEEKYKMPISNPNPSNSVLTKKIPKKPILNREILEDIFIEIMKVNTSMRSWSDSPSEKNIARFMASGRQPFNIALNYFTRINSVNIWRNTTHLYMNNETICKFTFEYFAFLKPVLYAIGSSIKKFVFCDAVGVDIDMIFDALIHEGIEYVCVDEKVPEKSLTKLCQITSIKDLSGPFTYSHLPLICSKSPAFGFYTDFKELIKEKPENFSMPWVKDLLISLYYEIPDFTKNSTQLFSEQISEIFPNLETIKIYFCCINPTWKSIYEIIKVIEPNWFKNLSENIKGEIVICDIIKNVESEEEWHKMIEGDQEFVVHSFMARRNFFIHRNLELFFTLQC